MAATRALRAKTLPIGGLTLALTVAAGIGAAAFLRGPDAPSTAMPILADRPVHLPGGRLLHVQKYEVSVAEWNACHEAGACALELRTRPGFTAGAQPATGLNFVDAAEYVAWISAETGHAFRLPTAAEWAVMARDVLPSAPDPIFTDPALDWASAYVTAGDAPRALRPRGGYSTSPEGIADLDGSVWEWTQDCYAEGIDPDRCPAFHVGGEHVAAMSYLERDPARGGCAVGQPPAHLGLRLVSDRGPLDI
jgi:formylglycine-generating enzyme required for sulfatase activity